MLEALPFGMYVVDREGKVILWSEGAERISGYLRQEVLGRSCQDEFLKHCNAENNPLEGTMLPLLATLHEGRPASGQLSLSVKGGHFLPVQIQTVPLRDDCGALVGAVEIFESLATQVRDERRQNKLSA